MTLAHWRDIAILLLVVEALLASVLVLILTFLLATIVRRTESALRDVLIRGQNQVASIAAQTDAVSRERLVRPVVRVHAAHAGARAFVRSVIKSMPLPHR